MQKKRAHVRRRIAVSTSLVERMQRRWNGRRGKLYQTAHELLSGVEEYPGLSVRDFDEVLARSGVRRRQFFAHLAELRPDILSMKVGPLLFIWAPLAASDRAWTWTEAELAEGFLRSRRNPFRDDVQAFHDAAMARRRYLRRKNPDIFFGTPVQPSALTVQSPTLEKPRFRGPINVPPRFPEEESSGLEGGSTWRRQDLDSHENSAPSASSLAGRGEPQKGGSIFEEGRERREATPAPPRDTEARDQGGARAQGASVPRKAVLRPSEGDEDRAVERERQHRRESEELELRRALARAALEAFENGTPFVPPPVAELEEEEAPAGNSDAEVRVKTLVQSMRKQGNVTGDDVRAFFLKWRATLPVPYVRPAPGSAARQADESAFASLAEWLYRFDTAAAYWQWLREKLHEYGQETRNDGHSPRNFEKKVRLGVE